MKSRLALTVVVALTCAASELMAQRGTGRVTGTIQDTQGNPIEGAQIVAEIEATNFRLEATSDEKGRWALLGFRNGSYSFTFSANGFVPQQTTASIRELAKNPPMDVTLEPIQAGTALASGAAAQLLNEGNLLYDQKDYAGALTKYQQILVEAPTLYQIRQNIGNCYLEMGELDKAMAEYEAVLDQEPTHIGALVRMGDVMVRKNDYDQAVTYFEKAIELAPEDEILPFNVAEIYFNQGNVEKAIVYYQRSSQVKPDWPEPYLKIGYAYINLAQMDKAAEAFQKVLEVAPDSNQAQQAKMALDSMPQP